MTTTEIEVIIEAEMARTKEAEALAKEPQSGAASRRLVSLDALRGFNMFWIIGGADLISAIGSKIHNHTVRLITNNLTEHVEWEGFHFHDLIFPMFLFIVGAAIPFATAKRLELGQTKRSLTRHILLRVGLLFALGVINNGLFDFQGYDKLRIAGVLQRLALGYGFAALLQLYASPRKQAIVAASLLVAYYLIMRFIPVPGFPLGDMSQHGNLANYLDRHLFKPGQMYETYGDPEGPLSTITAFATGILGTLAGTWLRSTRTQNEKTIGLLVSGAACIAVGYLWSPLFPIIKKIWTSSFVLVAGGWSLLFLALFYYLIDVRGWKRWTLFFVVIGLNPITIYVGQNIIDFEHIAAFFVKGALEHIPYYKDILFAVSVLAAKWLFLRFLHRQKIYLRV